MFGARSPPLPCSMVSSERGMIEGNVCWKTSATAALASSITLSRFCPEPLPSLSACPALRLQRKMLPEPGIRADHLSKAGLKWLSNGQRIKPLSRLSFHLSSAALPFPCLFLFHRASLSDGRKEIMCSGAWGRRLGSVKESGKTPTEGEGGLNNGIQQPQTRLRLRVLVSAPTKG